MNSPIVRMLISALALATPPALLAEDAGGLEFFEKRIRPLLAERCYECHSGERKVKGGLRLDTREGWSKGGDTGPALVPGEPGKSQLLAAVRWEDPDLQMPPKHRLTPAQVGDLESWIKMGAPDPRVSEPSATAATAAVKTDHWSYQPLQHPAPPAVQTAAWPRGDLDRFLLAKLEAKKLRPVPDADRAALCRRVYFDLIGLPPTPEELDAFVADTAPDAFWRLVDQLLASPHFGERWGRHWLDVARFAESTGGGRTMLLKEAWRYRDYVIEAFNRDRPFDQFIREQIAGDLLPAASLEDRHRQLVATAFLALGPTNYEEQDKKQLRMDVVDEQLDTIGKAFLGQTIGCARCHDHKFDPIPTRDYYALAGILRNTKTFTIANVANWIEVALPVPPEEEKAFKEHEGAVAALQEKIKAAQTVSKRAGKKPEPGAKSIAVKDLPGIVVDDQEAKPVGEWKGSRHVSGFIGEQYVTDTAKGTGQETLTFAPMLPKAGVHEVRLAYTPGANRASNVPVTIFHADGEETIRVNQRVIPPIDGHFVSLGKFPLNANSYVLLSNDGADGYVIGDAVQFLPLDNAATPAPANARATPESAAPVKALEAELKKLQQRGPKRPMTMSVKEEDQIEEARVHIRGSWKNLGTEVPRGFLSVVLRTPAPALPEKESGRRELADWTASAENPLTGRVFVNRVWHWLFGAGLVPTNDNFGTTGEAPSHPELLDWLTRRFIERGWSSKQLIREIVLSRAYQLSTADDAAALAADPENRLLWRMNRRRLQAESLRDATLAISGQLKRELGGPNIASGTANEYGYQFTDLRRGVYTPVFRNNLPDLFEAFDFASPNTVTGRRTVSTVPTQALFFLNHPFIAEQARAAAERMTRMEQEESVRIERAYRETLGREPTSAERALAQRHLGSAANAPEAWTQLYHALFASLDFRYLD
ncbi:MAG: DUF1553 domain-containing protein [Verrucomicrobiota bacterium]|nr:DUF1553 domain-containing protein [Verrucomicrobiota bacterium]